MIKGTDCGIVLYELLKDIEGIEGRVYPIIAENGPKSPFIVYQRQSLTPVYVKEGWVEDVVSVSIDVASSDYATSVRIAEAVRAILDEYRVDKASLQVKDCRLMEASEQYQDNAGFIQSLTYNMSFCIAEQ